MATYLDPNQQNKQATGTSTPFPPQPGMPNPLGTSMPGPTVADPNPMAAPGPTANTTLYSPPSAPGPVATDPNPMGAPGPVVTDPAAPVSAPGPMANTPTSAPGPTVSDPNPQAAPGPTVSDPSQPNYGGWVPETLNGMRGYRNPATGQWVPGDHPIAGAAGAPVVNPISGAGTPAPGPTANGPAAPGGQTEEDMVAQALREMIQRPATVDRASAEIRQQVEPIAAANTRERRMAENEAAERAAAQGMGQSGALDVERRMLQERAAQKTGLHEADIVGRELNRIRDEKVRALELATQRGMSDEARQLQRELAQLDAQIRRESIASSSALGGRELDIRERLGNRGLEIDMIRTLLNNRQFGQDLGFRIGATEAEMNDRAMRYLLGG